MNPGIPLAVESFTSSLIIPPRAGHYECPMEEKGEAFPPNGGASAAKPSGMRPTVPGFPETVPGFAETWQGFAETRQRFAETGQGFALMLEQIGLIRHHFRKTVEDLGRMLQQISHLLHCFRQILHQRDRNLDPSRRTVGKGGGRSKLRQERSRPRDCQSQWE